MSSWHEHNQAQFILAKVCHVLVEIFKTLQTFQPTRPFIPSPLTWPVTTLNNIFTTAETAGTYKEN